MRTPQQATRCAISVGAFFALIGLLASGCSSDDAGTSSATGPRSSTATTASSVVTAAAPIPVSADALPAGTELGNGFAVPEGAVLLGPPTPIDDGFTYDGVPVADRGWNATLVVPGDPRAVIADLQDQALAADLELRPGDDHEGGMGKVDAYCREAERGYVCAARGSRGSGVDIDFIDVELVRRRGGFGAPPMSHLWLTYSDSDRPLLRPLTADPDLPLGPEPPPVSRDWWKVPGPGDLVLGGVFPDDFAGIEIQKGTRLIGPPGNSQGSGYSAWDLHIAIDPETGAQSTEPEGPGDESTTHGQRIAYRYARQIADAIGSSDLWWGDPWTTPGGTAVRRVIIAQPGGFTFDLIVTEPGDGTATLTITTGYD